MPNMKKILGFGLVSSPFIAITILMAQDKGIVYTCYMWLSIIALVLVLAGGVVLIQDG